MSRELKTGIVAVVIIALSIWGYNFMKRQDIFNPTKRTFYIEYKSIQGLNEASLVTINGLKVGKVNSIDFNSNPAKRGSLVVEVVLDNSFEFSKNSIAKIYSASLMGGQNLAIIPNYEGEPAVSGDYLKGEVESDIFTSVGEKLNPIQSKIESVIVTADSLLTGMNSVFNLEARKSLNRTVIGLEATVKDVRNTISRVDSLVNFNSKSLNKTIENTEKITANFSKVSEDLTKIDINATIKKIEGTLSKVNSILAQVESGKGTFGKLMKDDKLYTNLTNASKEMEELLREMKLNPKRFVHFSLFGKKAKAYNKENNKNNTSNK